MLSVNVQVTHLSAHAPAVARRAGLSPEKVRPQEGTSAVLNPLEAAYADRRIERFSHCVERSERYYDALVADFRFWMSE